MGLNAADRVEESENTERGKNTLLALKFSWDLSTIKRYRIPQALSFNHLHN